MKRSVIIFALVTAVLLVVSQVGYCVGNDSTSEERLKSLGDYLRYGALHNAGLKSAFENWKATLEQVPQAKVLPDPRFTYAYFIEQVETRVGPQENKFGISQTFPWFGKIKARTDAAAAMANAAQEKYQAEKLRLFYRVKDAFYEYVYLKSAISIAKQNLELLKHFEEVARIKYMTAAVRHPDIIRAQIALATLEDKVKSLEQLRQPITAELNSILNRQVNSPLEWPQRPGFELVEISRNEVIAAMRTHNPELTALQFEITAARSLITLAKKKVYPDITVGLDWIQTGSANNPNLSDSGKDPIVAMVSMNLPIWGESYKAAERQAKLRLAKTSSKRIQKENDIISLLAKVMYNYDDSNRKIDLYRDVLIPKAKEMVQTSEVAYRAAEVDFFSLIDAQRKLLSFELLYERALTDNRQRLAEIQMLTGSELGNPARTKRL